MTTALTAGKGQATRSLAGCGGNPVYYFKTVTGEVIDSAYKTLIHIKQSAIKQDSGGLVNLK